MRPIDLRPHISGVRDGVESSVELMAELAQLATLHHAHPSMGHP